VFGLIFSGGPTKTTYGFADLDGSTQSAQLKEAFEVTGTVTLETGSEDELLARMRDGDVAGVIVVPSGYGAGLGSAIAPTMVKVYTDPSQSQADARTRQVVAYVLGGVNTAVAGRPPAVMPEFATIQTTELNFLSYLIPSILAMALMQLGVFAAVPLVADREKLILKRLSVTPIRRWAAGRLERAPAAAHRRAPDRDHHRRRDAVLRARDDRPLGDDPGSSSCWGP
jgi:hypothetical protein